MINAMTFESSGADHNLTWARDDAAVMDAIFSSRTSNEMNRASGERHPELTSRGSSPIYISDFQGEMTNGTLKIQVMRGYIAGRYFEVADELVTGYTHSRGKGFVHFIAAGWRTDDTPIIRFLYSGSYETMAGQVGGRKAINEVSRDKTTRRLDHDIYAKFRIFWNYQKSPSAVAITFENTNIVNVNVAEYDPSMITTSPYYAGLIKPWNDVTSNGVSSDILMDTNFVSVGDKRTGSIVVVGGSYKTTDSFIDLTPKPHTKSSDVTKSRMTSFVYGNTPTVTSANASIITSGYLGIYHSTPSYWNPTVWELFNKMYNVLGNQTYLTKYHPAVSDKPPSGLPLIHSSYSPTFTDPNRVVLNSATFNSDLDANSSKGSIVSPLAYSNNSGVQSFKQHLLTSLQINNSKREIFSVYNPQFGALRVNDFTINVSSVKYMLESDYARQPSSNRLIIPHISSGFNALNDGVIEVTVNVSYPSLRYPITGYPHTETSPKWMTLKNSYPSTVKVLLSTKAVVRYRHDPTYNNYKSEVNYGIDEIKNWIAASGSSEFEVYKRLVTPAVIADILRFEIDNSADILNRELFTILNNYLRLDKGTSYSLWWSARGVTGDKTILQ